MEKLQGNSLLVIGNGFDRACGLESTYKEYFDYRIEHNDSMKALYGFYMEYAFGNIYSEKDLIALENIFQIYAPNKSSTSVWDLYLLKQYSENPDWFQVESELRNAFSADSYYWDFSCVFKDDHIRSFESESKKNFLTRFSMNRYKTLRKSKYSKEVWSEYLLKQLKVFEKNFGDYIGNAQLSEEYNENANKLLSRIKSETMDIGDIKTIESFNYSEPKLGLPIRHINGDFHTPIFGLDSAPLDLDCLFSFTKTSRRMELQFSNKYNSNRKDFDNLIVYGHSLNEQDYNYFFPIFDYLKISEATETKKIVFCYSNHKKNAKAEAQDGIKKLIFAYGEYLNLDSKHQLRLLDSITTTGRMKIVEIEKLKKSADIKSNKKKQHQTQNGASSQQSGVTA